MFVALLMDVLMVLSYLWQSSQGGQVTYWIGFVLQIILTIGVLSALISYQGKRYKNPVVFGFFTATVRYGILLISLVGGALLAFLYALNLFGANSVIFGA